MFRISTQMMSDRTVATMLNQQSKLFDTQLQLSTGKRIIAPSDDPAGASRVLGLNGAIETVKQFQSNADRAEARLQSEESILIGAGNVLQRANELAVQGSNSPLTPLDKAAVAGEVRQLLDELFALANSRDSGGEYIFAGYQTGSRPFTRGPAGFTYEGDLGQRKLQISADRQIADGDNGYDLFMNVTTGPVATVNGVAAVTFDAIAAGDITLDGGSSNGPVALGALPAAANPEERAQQLKDAINAVATETGVLAHNDTASTVLMEGLEGDISINLTGSASTDNTGLTAATTPATVSKRSMFDTLEQLATTLEGEGLASQYITDIRLALDSVIDTRTTVGARLNTIDEQLEVNSGIELVMKTHRSEEEDLDFVEAITRFQRQQVALEAAQQAYVKIQGLSLFNFIQ